MVSGSNAFVIPKKRVGLSVQHLEKSSREYADIARNLKSSILHFSKAHFFTITDIYEIYSGALATQYNKTKRAWKEKGYSEDGVSDHYAYLDISWMSVSAVKDLLQFGPEIGNLTESVLGDPKQAVQLPKHPDVITQRPYQKYSRKIVMFKIMKGRIKKMEERIEHLSDLKREATWGYNCHCTATSGSAKTYLNFFLAKMWYLYLYEGDDVVRHPPQICPVAIVCVDYSEEKDKPVVSMGTTSFDVEAFKAYLTQSVGSTTGSAREMLASSSRSSIISVSSDTSVDEGNADHTQSQTLLSSLSWQESGEEESDQERTSGMDANSLEDSAIADATPKDKMIKDFPSLQLSGSDANETVFQTICTKDSLDEESTDSHLEREYTYTSSRRVFARRAARVESSDSDDCLSKSSQESEVQQEGKTETLKTDGEKEISSESVSDLLTMSVKRKRGRPKNGNKLHRFTIKQMVTYISDSACLIVNAREMSNCQRRKPSPTNGQAADCGALVFNSTESDTLSTNTMTCPMPDCVGGFQYDMSDTIQSPAVSTINQADVPDGWLRIVFGDVLTSVNIQTLVSRAHGNHRECTGDDCDFGTIDFEADLCSLYVQPLSAQSTMLTERTARQCAEANIISLQQVQLKSAESLPVEPSEPSEAQPIQPNSAAALLEGPATAETPPVQQNLRTDVLALQPNAAQAPLTQSFIPKEGPSVQPKHMDASSPQSTAEDETPTRKTKMSKSPIVKTKRITQSRKVKSKTAEAFAAPLHANREVKALQRDETEASLLQSHEIAEAPSVPTNKQTEASRLKRLQRNNQTAAMPVQSDKQMETLSVQPIELMAFHHAQTSEPTALPPSAHTQNYTEVSQRRRKSRQKDDAAIGDVKCPSPPPKQADETLCSYPAKLFTMDKDGYWLQNAQGDIRLVLQHTTGELYLMVGCNGKPSFGQLVSADTNLKVIPNTAGTVYHWMCSHLVSGARTETNFALRFESAASAEEFKAHLDGAKLLLTSSTNLEAETNCASTAESDVPAATRKKEETSFTQPLPTPASPSTQSQATEGSRWLFGTSPSGLVPDPFSSPSSQCVSAAVFGEGSCAVNPPPSSSFSAHSSPTAASSAVPSAAENLEHQPPPSAVQQSADLPVFGKRASVSRQSLNSATPSTDQLAAHSFVADAQKDLRRGQDHSSVGAQSIFDEAASAVAEIVDTTCQEVCESATAELAKISSEHSAHKTYETCGTPALQMEAMYTDPCEPQADAIARITDSEAVNRAREFSDHASIAQSRGSNTKARTLESVDVCASSGINLAERLGKRRLSKKEAHGIKPCKSLPGTGKPAQLPREKRVRFSSRTPTIHYYDRARQHAVSQPDNDLVDSIPRVSEKVHLPLLNPVSLEPQFDNKKGYATLPVLPLFREKPYKTALPGTIESSASETNSALHAGCDALLPTHLSQLPASLIQPPSQLLYTPSLFSDSIPSVESPGFSINAETGGLTILSSLTEAAISVDTSERIDSPILPSTCVSLHSSSSVTDFQKSVIVDPNSKGSLLARPDNFLTSLNIPCAAVPLTARSSSTPKEVFDQGDSKVSVNSENSVLEDLSPNMTGSLVGSRTSATDSFSLRMQTPNSIPHSGTSLTSQIGIDERKYFNSIASYSTSPDSDLEIQDMEIDESTSQISLQECNIIQYPSAVEDRISCTDNPIHSPKRNPVVVTSTDALQPLPDSMTCPEVSTITSQKTEPAVTETFIDLNALVEAFIESEPVDTRKPRKVVKTPIATRRQRVQRLLSNASMSPPIVEITASAGNQWSSSSQSRIASADESQSRTHSRWDKTSEIFKQAAANDCNYVSGRLSVEHVQLTPSGSSSVVQTVNTLLTSSKPDKATVPKRSACSLIISSATGESVDPLTRFSPEVEPVVSLSGSLETNLRRRKLCHKVSVDPDRQDQSLDTPDELSRLQCIFPFWPRRSVTPTLTAYSDDLSVTVTCDNFHVDRTRDCLWDTCPLSSDCACVCSIYLTQEPLHDWNSQGFQDEDTLHAIRRAISYPTEFLGTPQMKHIITLPLNKLLRYTPLHELDRLDSCNRSEG